MALRKRNDFWSSASAGRKNSITATIFYSNLILGLSYKHVEGCASFSKSSRHVDSYDLKFQVSGGAVLVGSLSYIFASRYLGRGRSAPLYLFLCAVALCALPCATSTLPMLILLAIGGIGFGGYSAAQTAIVFNMWDYKCGPFVMAQFAFYSLGQLFSGAFFAAFLLDDNNETGSQWIPFEVTGVLTLVGAAAQAALMHAESANPRRMLRNEVEETMELGSLPVEVEDQVEHVPRRNVSVDRQLLLLTCLYIGVAQTLKTLNMDLNTYKCLEWLFSSFTTQDINFFCLAIGRLIGIKYILKARMLFTSALLISIGVILLSIDDTVCHLFGVYFMGVGFSWVYPVFLVYAGKYIEVTDFRAALIAAVGWIAPFLFSFTDVRLSSETPEIMAYVTLGCLPVVCGLFVAFEHLKNKHGYTGVNFKGEFQDRKLFYADQLKCKKPDGHDVLHFSLHLMCHFCR